jgi:hypothetical protein
VDRRFGSWWFLWHGCGACLGTPSRQSRRERPAPTRALSAGSLSLSLLAATLWTHSIKEALAAWDLARTDALVEQLGRLRLQVEAAVAEEKRAAAASAAAGATEAKDTYDRTQQVSGMHAP